ncbi:MAG: hypothetical protein M1817_003897 [Caeruleum heppii]|nr:MAG: hypothetical protein M1817_003897 [Caeruleum heppii]
MPSTEEKREVFLFCRGIFAGQNAQLRKKSKVRELLQQHGGRIGPLVSKYGSDSIFNTARHLLEKKVFESNLRAKIEFPDLYEISASRGAQRTASENEAARSEAEALAEAEPTQGESVDPSELDLGTPQTTQTLLERVCFEFGQKWLPQVLEARKWNCQEAVELTKWTKILSKHKTQLPKDAISTGHGPLNDSVVFATERLRHAAVHRLPSTAAGVQQMISSAAKLASALNDTMRAAKIEHLHDALETHVRDMEGNKEFLESRLDQEFKAIDEQRAKLDRRECEAVAAMVSDDNEHQASLGPLLDQATADLLDELPHTSSVATEETTHAASCRPHEQELPNRIPMVLDGNDSDS